MAHALGQLIGCCRVGFGDPALHAARHFGRFGAWLALAFAILSPAFAQPAAPPPVRFAVFSPKPISNVVFTPRANAGPQKIASYPTARSPRYEFRGAMPLKFTDATTGAVVAEAIIPPEMRDALLLFTAIEPVPATGLRYRVAVLDDGAARQAAGALAIINLSGLALSGTVNQENVTLKAGLNSPLAVGRSAKIILRTPVGEKSVQSYSDTVELKKNERALLILFPPYYKGSLEVQARMLLDEPPTAAK